MGIFDCDRINSGEISVAEFLRKCWMLLRWSNLLIPINIPFRIPKGLNQSSNPTPTGMESNHRQLSPAYEPACIPLPTKREHAIYKPSRNKQRAAAKQPVQPPGLLPKQAGDNKYINDDVLTKGNNKFDVQIKRNHHMINSEHL